MDAFATLGFLLFAATMVATPGPANMVLMAGGARFGFRAVLPFVCGVALGKQLIIWPLGLGVMSAASLTPMAVVLLRWASVAYILWLAWKVLGLRLSKAHTPTAKAPGFVAGLVVHPLNPKAWVMITTGLTTFTGSAAAAVPAVLTISLCLLACQAVFHPLWAYAGVKIAALVAGRAAERCLMGVLAVVMVGSVLWALVAAGG